jgi:phosphoserine aminotransferase
MQFSCVPFNLARSTSTNAHYIQTGVWTKKAVEEAKRLGLTNVTVHKPLQDRIAIEIPSDASYVYYCSNETVDGIKYCRDCFY